MATVLIFLAVGIATLVIIDRGKHGHWVWETVRSCQLCRKN